MQAMHHHIGETIKRLRTEKNLSQEALGQSIGATKSYIWKMENRTPADPSIKNLKAIADVLGVSIGYLLSESQTGQESEQDTSYWEKYLRMDDDVKSKVRQFIDMFG